MERPERWRFCRLAPARPVGLLGINTEARESLCRLLWGKNTPLQFNGETVGESMGSRELSLKPLLHACI